MNRNTVHFSMAQTDEWLDHLRAVNRKDNTIHTHRNNVKRCLMFLHADYRPTDAFEIGVDDINYLWRAIPVKETVRIAYLRSLSGMVEYHSGINILKRTELLRHRDSHDRVFIRDGEFRKAYIAADPLQRLVLCLGAYMGLRRCEMHAIRDGDIDRGILTIHGKGHGSEGLVAYMRIPAPVLEAIDEYRVSDYKRGIRKDDYLIQCRNRDERIGHMPISRISDCMTDLAHDTGVRITTHSLRRYYATTLYYTTGTDLQTVRKLMRHADISTTLKCYIDAYDETAMLASDRLTRHIEEVLDGTVTAR